LGHDDFEDCETNLIPTREDAEGWATRFRLLSGRPLDEANPVLDTELYSPGGRARVCAITRTLSPEGIGYALRRHRERPWTYPLFLDAKFFDPIFAGLMSFLVDGARSLLFSGGRSSGKTSLLSATLLEIMKKFRIVTVEDSVAGDCEIVFERNGMLERKEIGKLIDELMEKYGCEIENGREILRKNTEYIKVFSVDSRGKVRLREVKSFIRHKVKKEIFEIETRTGRKIRVTGDHSLFTLDRDGKIVPVKVKNLRIGDYLVTPRRLPLTSKSSHKNIDLLDHLDKLDGTYILGSPIREIIKKYRKEIKKIAVKFGYAKDKSYGYPRSAIQWWKRRSLLPCEVLRELKKKKKIEINSSELKIKVRNTPKLIPVNIRLDADFLRFIGLWLADGCYDRGNMIISVVDEHTRDVIHKIAERFGVEVKEHSDGFSLMLGSKVLRVVMKNIFDLRGDAYTKRIPEWVFSLSKDQIADLLKGIFSGDCYLAEYEVAINLTSLGMIKDIQTLLLSFGIVSRINRMNEKDKTYSCKISGLKFLRIFFEEIGFLQKSFMEKLKKICERKVTHDTSDIIPFTVNYKEKLSQVFTGFNRYDYTTRGFNVGGEKLKSLLNQKAFNGGDLENLEFLAKSDIFWDEIRDIKVSEEECFVYDISVEEDENFVCENILAHNTLEIPVVQLRNLGYNIERLKSRSVITRVEAELPADEALRTAIRLGDSCLIVGEVRSVEARALFEAMRIGALTNVVAGTIHGESAYGVFDRIVNDLGVPPTSFKATDIIVICGRLRTADGLHTFRRVLEVTEVRKYWQRDPVEEGGFVNLMEYDAKEDMLKPTETLVNGESFVVNEIAKRVKEWHGNWDAVWSNIELRGRVKQAMVDYARKLGNKEILEAEWTSLSNEMFHVFSNEVREELGYLDSKEIFKRWDEWFKKMVK
jgi:intein/homing endonuclease/type IV secretory pathway ATPase VirB11/archaellum biosynthesis ATPase